MQILILDGSIGGPSGNTAQVLEAFQRCVHEVTENAANKIQVDFKLLQLSQKSTLDREILRKADAFVFATGTYWDSWGSPMQKFFEEATSLEGDECWLGKPAALITTMHSVGGKEVLNRLHGVINSFGLFVPPMCAFTYSFANHLAIQAPTAGFDETTRDFADDLWRLEDLATVASNLLTALELSKSKRVQWKAWTVDREDANRLWLTNRSDLRR